ncbi:MAG: transcriptional repressor [Cyanobacteria bacterium SIG30]|nr:transcriptional repressor [Cyanobacteria bacterium SIG30]
MKKERNTYQKEIILKTLQEFVVHPSAEELYKKISENYPEIGIATVYRNLNKMASDGTIKKIEGLSSQSHFDHNTFEHFHFICEKCGKIFDIPKEVAPEIVKKVEDNMGFKILNYDVILSGICKNCKGEKND